MRINDIMALFTLFLATAFLYVVGYFCLLKPQKIKEFTFKQMDFFHKYHLVLFYRKRKEMMSGTGFLLYLRLMGVIVVLTASLFLFLFFYKLKRLAN